MASRFALLFAFVSLFILQAVQPVYASFYNERYYSYCVYNWIDECPDEFDPIGKGYEEDPDVDVIEVIRADADLDDKQEEAADQDKDKNNGYEVFKDPDGSSQLFAAIDGDGDGKIDFLLVSSDEGKVEHYWDPDNGIINIVVIQDIDNDGEDEYLFDSDGDSILDAYYDFEEDKVYRIVANRVRLDVDQDDHNESAINQDLNDRNGFEVYEDIDGSSSVYRTIDGDGDGKIDFLLLVDGSSDPLSYWDPDRAIVANVIAANTDDDEPVEFVFDSDDDGLADKYYDRETDRVYDFELPGERRFTGDNFGGFLYQKLGDLLRGLPAPVVTVLPLVVTGLLAALAGLFFIQGRTELKRSIGIKQFIETERAIVQHRNDFIALISHYLRTPLTIISGYNELLSNQTSGNTDTLQRARNSTTLIHELSEDLIDEMQEQTELPVTSTLDPQRVLRKRFLFYAVPFLLVGLSLTLIQFALADFRVISISNWWLIILLLASLLLILAGLFLLRRLQIHHAEKSEQKALLDKRQKIDEAKQQFIGEAAEKLSSGTKQLLELYAPLQQQEEYKKILGAAEELQQTVAKFSLVSSLKMFSIDDPNHHLFQLSDAIAEQIKQKSDAIESKKLRVDYDPIQFPAVDTNRVCVDYILSTLLDNAIKYSPDGGTIRLKGSYSPDSGQLLVHVIDEGPGIDPKMAIQLFEPFSRVEGSEFSQTGIGFSLYLDRLLAEYIRGDIKINPSPTAGTDIMLKLPVT